MERKYVYVMRGTKWMYKIGISNNPNRRLKEVAHKPKLIVSYKYFFADVIEDLMHNLFNTSRRTREGSGKTEWFRLGPIEILLMHGTLLFMKIIHDLSILILIVGLIFGGIWLCKNYEILGVEKLFQFIF